MADQQDLVPAPRGLIPVTTCWMCGIRLSPGHMVSDGGSACADLRWYCLDVRGCTERWTARAAGPAEARPGPVVNAGVTGQVADLHRRRLAGSGTGPESQGANIRPAG